MNYISLIVNLILYAHEVDIKIALFIYLFF